MLSDYLFYRAISPESGGGSSGDYEALVKAMVEGESFSLESDAVTKIEDSVFYLVNGLSYVSFPNAVSVGFSAFYYSGLTGADLPNVETIGNVAFKSTKLKSISLPNAWSIGEDAFASCHELTEIDFPKMTYLPSLAFSFCEKLKTVNIPKVNTIRNRSFSGCSSLSNIVLREVLSIGESAFYNCTNLTNVNIPLVGTIPKGAFENCTQLTKVDLHKVTSIGDQAFYGCENLTALIIRTTSTVCVTSFSALVDTPIVQGTGHIYVPSAMYENYRAGYEPAMNEAGLTGMFDIMFRKIEDYPEICG